MSVSFSFIFFKVGEHSTLNAPINSKVQHPPRANPGQPPGHLNFWRLACSNSLPSGQKSRPYAPPISTELPLLKGKFHLQANTLHAFQREIRRNDTFILLLKTLLKELFTNKGEILSCKSVKPCKNRKNSRAYYVGTRNKSGSNSPPFQPNVQIPPYPGTMHSQMPGVCPGGNVEVLNWSAHKYSVCMSGTERRGSLGISKGETRAHLFSPLSAPATQATNSKNT